MFKDIKLKPECKQEIYHYKKTKQTWMKNTDFKNIKM